MLDVWLGGVRLASKVAPFLFQRNRERSLSMSLSKALHRLFIGEKRADKRPGPNDMLVVEAKSGGFLTVRDSEMDSKRLGAKIVEFTSFDLPYIKNHGLRALCGFLMDRHSACGVCPFCNLRQDDDVDELIVRVDGQRTPTGDPVVALYFCKAARTPDGYKAESIEDWAAHLGYAEATPQRKAVVQLLDNGAYYAVYGPIANPTEGDYSTGMLDRTGWTLDFYCDPEPTHTRWTYWESQNTPGQLQIPEFLCLRLRGEWWIVDRDMERGMVKIQQVAALAVADKPDHWMKVL